MRIGGENEGLIGNYENYVLNEKKPQSYRNIKETFHF